MSIDLSQFYQVFFEESQEHLAELENVLVALDIASPDAEQINSVFRAAHSIKGSSSTFGFHDVTEVTHVMETLLDQVRKGDRPVTTQIVDACLEASDVVKNLLAAHQGHGEADRVAAATVRQKLQALADQKTASTPVDRNPHYAVSCRLSGAPEQFATLKERLLAELHEVGLVSGLEEGADNQLAFRLTTLLDTTSLKTLLEYVVDADSLVIMEGDALAPGAADTAPPAGEPAQDDSFGLFEPLAAQNPPEGAATADDGSFGLFEPLSPPPSGAEPAAAASGSAVSAKPAALAPEAVPVHTPAKPAQGRAGGGVGIDAGSIRVSVEKVDQMINLVGELVITQAMLAQAARRCDPVVFEDLLNSVAHLERNTRNLQESVMSVRMLPISMVFSRFPRVVRDLSQKLGKQVQLVEYGENTELDKTLIERITDPLTHLVRNSLDHGIESAEVRRAAGKTEMGTITLRAYHQSGSIVIEVADDGAGLRRDKILAKARERGLAVSDGMSDQEVWMLIFDAGFSTAETVTEVSGRGVGMDVVRKNISELGGRIEIDSVAGVGTRVAVRLPLTLAIVDGMSVGVGSDAYIIPLDYVVESLQATSDMLKSVGGNQCLLQVRGDYLPVLRLHQMFGVSSSGVSLTEGIMVVLESDGVKAALFVDELIGQGQFVIKSLEANYRRVQGIAGATILGDGHVALIVDAAALVGAARRSLPAAA